MLLIAKIFGSENCFRCRDELKQACLENDQQKNSEVTTFINCSVVKP